MKGGGLLRWRLGWGLSCDVTPVIPSVSAFLALKPTCMVLCAGALRLTPTIPEFCPGFPTCCTFLDRGGSLEDLSPSRGGGPRFKFRFGDPVRSAAFEADLVVQETNVPWALAFTKPLCGFLWLHALAAIRTGPLTIPHEGDFCTISNEATVYATKWKNAGGGYLLLGCGGHCCLIRKF